MYFAAVPTYWKPSAARSLPEFLNVESRCPNFRAATNSSESGLEWRPLPPAPKRPVAAARYPKGACRHRWGGRGGWPRVSVDEQRNQNDDGDRYAEHQK